MTIYKRVGIFIVLLLGAAAPVFGQDCSGLTATIEATNNGIICSGNSVTLTAKPTGGSGPYGYTWNTGAVTDQVSASRGGRYDVLITDQTTGCQIHPNIDVTETPPPPRPTITGTTTICRGSTTRLTAQGSGSTVTYKWYTAATGGSPFFEGPVYDTQPIQDLTFYYVEATVGDCVSTRTMVTINMGTQPTTTNGAACAGTSGTVSASGGDTYTWYAEDGTPLQSGPDPTYTSPALTTTTKYYVVATLNNCASAPTPAFINVTPYPDKPTTQLANIPICSGSVATMHAAGNGMLDWFDTETGGTSIISSPDYTTPPLTETKTYWVQSTVNGCASQRLPITITVNAIPDPPITQTTSTCANSTATLTAKPTGTKFNWYADEAGIKLLGTGETYLTPELSTPTDYYVQTVSDAGCVSTTFSKLHVDIIPRPAAPSVSPPAPVCPNSTATLTVNAPAPGNDYNWYAEDGTSLGSGNSIVTPVITADTKFYVEAQVNGCTSSPRTAVPVTTLTTVSEPTANNVNITPGNRATLSASGASNYQWYDVPTGGTPVASTASWTTPVLNTTTSYYVQTTVGECQSTRKRVTVTVANPQSPTVPTVAPVCPGIPISITASVTDGGTIYWYEEQTGGGPLFIGNTFTATLYQTTTYWVQNKLNGIYSPRVQVNIPIVPINYPQFKYTSATYCRNSGNQAPIINDPAGGKFSATPTGLVFISTTTGEINIAASLPKNYTITFTGNEACQAKTQSPFNIVSTPDARFTYNSPFCQYGPNIKPAFTVGASEGYFSSTPGGLVFVDQATGEIDMQKTTPGTYTITNTIAANGICAATSASQLITISPGISTYAGKDLQVNLGESAQLAGVISGTVTTGHWTGGNGTFSPDRNTLNAVYTPAPGETSVRLTLVSDAPLLPSCTGAKSDDMVITIIPKPAKPVVNTQLACNGQQITLTAQVPAGTVNWYDTETATVPIASGLQFTTPVITANVTYWVDVTESGNTSDRKQVDVTLSPTPEAPTALPGQACMNQPATLTAQGSTGNYAWYSVESGGTALPSNNGTLITPPSPPTPFFGLKRSMPMAAPVCGGRG